MKNPHSQLLVRFALLFGLASASGCHRDPCPEGIDEGERFQVTVLAQTTPFSACQVPSLAVGDSFTLVAGPPVTVVVNSGDGQTDSCTGHGAQADVPPFFADVLTLCSTDADYQLGLMCTGTTAAGCAVSVVTTISTAIDRGATTIDHGNLLMTWTSSCESGSCLQNYDVRIDRLPALDGSVDGM